MLHYSYRVDHGSSEYEEVEWTWFPSPELAKAHAEVLAAKLAHSDPSRGVWLRVVSEEGREIARIRLTGQ